MSGPLGAMAAWFPATPMREHQGPRETVWRNAESRQQLTFATLQGRGLGTDRGNQVCHLTVIIQSEQRQNKTQPACFNGIYSFCRSERCGVDRVANPANQITLRSIEMLVAPIPPKTVKRPPANLRGVSLSRGHLVRQLFYLRRLGRNGH